MNKQQLASKIWETANSMRSKVDAAKYKDYMLGFIFYKYLSEKEEEYLKSMGWEEEYNSQLNEDNPDIVENIRQNIGYFISYDNLFSTWIKLKRDFTIANVTDALSAFNRLIYKDYRKVFGGIFDTLGGSFSNSSDTVANKTKLAKDIIYLINDIPMNSKQDYDVLGFIYEYLIGMFAANAGKKGGEFYTPHEASVLMSEIVAYYLQDREKIEVYDSTSGSGSLLINVGKSFAKYNKNPNAVKYYAQEINDDTYDLTRMNLIMRGINPSNIFVHKGDTLKKDWPLFDDDQHIEETYERVRVDAVLSNPPYSHTWAPSEHEEDVRYEEYGLAPKSKADYAFLLHDLYHIKPDGIMTIVLPHGVLFRGGEEAQIRQKLIEKGQIDTIIGLPRNIFFGTGIPTIIMILKKSRPTNDVLIIDASKGFEKVGPKNTLRSRDIKKILDVVKERKDVEKYSRCVSKEEIVANDYNLNIPRYVDSSEKEENWDIYATMFGGVPNKEIEELNKYWDVLPSLKDQLFNPVSSEYSKCVAENTDEIISKNKDVIEFKETYKKDFDELRDFLTNELIEKMDTINIEKEEEIISDYIFEKTEKHPLIDKYTSYQLLDDVWNKIHGDLDTIQREGLAAARIIDPVTKIKKEKGETIETRVGWEGRVTPFKLVQETYFKDEFVKAAKIESELNENNSELNSLIENLSEDDFDIVDTDKTSFKATETKNALKKVYENIEIPGMEYIDEYLSLKGKKNKLEYQETHNQIQWSKMTPNRDGTYGKNAFATLIKTFQETYEFEEGSYEYTVKKADNLLTRNKELDKEAKELKKELTEKTMEKINKLTDEEILKLLKTNWIKPIVENIHGVPDSIIKELIAKVKTLSNKYKTTLVDIENEIKEAEQSLIPMMDDLTGNEFDMLGLQELKKILGGN